MVDVTTTPCWYILHTYAGYESMVKDNLERLIENNNLQEMIFDVKIPMEQTIEEKNGKRKVVERKLLPCYVFIKMIYCCAFMILILSFVHIHIRLTIRNVNRPIMISAISKSPHNSYCPHCIQSICILHNFPFY